MSTLPPGLLELLACPSPDHAPLRESERDGVPILVCTQCARAFPIQDGVPVLLLDEALPGGAGGSGPARGV